MTNTSHTYCLHPSTSSARAKCRKERAAATAAHRDELDTIIASFYDNSRDAEDIANDLHRLGIKSHCNTLINAAAGFYDNSIEIETMIYDATTAKYEL
jgi:hypothetical protein